MGGESGSTPRSGGPSSIVSENAAPGPSSPAFDNESVCASWKALTPPMQVRSRDASKRPPRRGARTIRRGHAAAK